MEGQKKLFLVADSAVIDTVQAYLKRFDGGRTDWQIEVVQAPDTSILRRIELENAILVADAALIS
ncbi:MAG: hypothetical protein LWX00_08375, partial [Spirochaetia bacterium]|nr:hypothetical protein [Spirochaetia bacterium]